ncbi:sucrase ferredoxin [Carbonactinospora thermoautotrophica]|uniref:sucrase ferredoxin n=1 Tax=Carbonactinospora thermoautotrophica TaxID=1469144 RepID=UPI002270C5E0|nr:sucrase ferredoxin [Carbonactinospora thermoautotrophica]
MTYCSTWSRVLAEPLAGTAPVARAWLAVEQPGPWGRNALTESHLDPVLGAELDRRATDAGIRVALIRPPGRHADTHHLVPRRILLAYTAPGRTWLEHAVVSDPAELLDLDLAALAAGERPGLGEPVAEPTLLVCTNARRDTCCALRGRPLAQHLARGYGDRVWETSHLGGHRFAPTAVVLPTGYAHGRIEDGAALLKAAEAGEVALETCRGRSTWARPGQVAELAVRHRTGESAVDALRVGEPVGDGAGAWLVHVTHADGRTWQVRVVRRPAEPPRPESCGKPPGRPDTYVAEEVSPRA